MICQKRGHVWACVCKLKKGEEKSLDMFLLLKITIILPDILIFFIHIFPILLKIITIYCRWLGDHNVLYEARIIFIITACLCDKATFILIIRVLHPNK